MEQKPVTELGAQVNLEVRLFVDVYNDVDGLAKVCHELDNDVLFISNAYGRFLAYQEPENFKGKYHVARLEKEYNEASADLTETMDGILKNPAYTDEKRIQFMTYMMQCLLDFHHRIQYQSASLYVRHKEIVFQRTVEKMWANRIIACAELYGIKLPNSFIAYMPEDKLKQIYDDNEDKLAKRDEYSKACGHDSEKMMEFDRINPTYPY